MKHYASKANLLCESSCELSTALMMMMLQSDGNKVQRMLPPIILCPSYTYVLFNIFLSISCSLYCVFTFTSAFRLSRATSRECFLARRVRPPFAYGTECKHAPASARLSPPPSSGTLRLL
ncbi:hypothetical protein IG631_01364 [Alternaria alternata]|nr:hypothetical protein IG631_01364 [Alternaria alternata]